MLFLCVFLKWWSQEKDFFLSCGFREIPKEDIPEQKIWADCIRCKLFPICNEIAMVKDIED